MPASSSQPRRVWFNPASDRPGVRFLWKLSLFYGQSRLKTTESMSPFPLFVWLFTLSDFVYLCAHMCVCAVSSFILTVSLSQNFFKCTPWRSCINLIWAMIRNAFLSPIPDLLNQKLWGLVPTIHVFIRPADDLN